MSKKRSLGEFEGEHPGHVICCPRKRQKGPRRPVVNAKPGAYSDNKIAHPVLSAYYPRVLSLREYLLSKLPQSSRTRRRILTKPIDSERPDANEICMQTTLDSTIVGVLQDSATLVEDARERDFKAFAQSQERSSLRQTNSSPLEYLQAEIVDYTIWALFHRASRSFARPAHLLCHGYVRAGAHGDRGPVDASPVRIPGVAVHRSNANVVTLKVAPWPQILQHLGSSGDAIMRSLLFDCGLFMQDNKDGKALAQISGIPLVELPSNIPSPTKIKLRPQGGNQKPDLRTLNQIVLVRSRILYARPALTANGSIRFGLRHIHVFNRFPKTSNFGTTIHLLKYVFPRQFGLHNVFTSATDPKETVQPFKDYTMREQEISRSSRETDAKKRPSYWLPRRLRGHPFRLVRRIHTRHQSCSYTALLRHYCPLGASSPDVLTVGPSDSSPSSTRLVTQGSTVVVGTASNNLTRLIDPRTTQTTTPDFATPTANVSAFCRAVLRKLLPASALGQGLAGSSNRRTFFRSVDIFVRMRRHESLSVHKLMQGLKLTSIAWLDNGTAKSTERISLSDLQKRTEISAEFLYYLFDSVLIPVIRSHFYVTESNTHRNHLFYFRHDVWRKISEPSLRALKSSIFEEIPHEAAKTILHARTLGFSQLRLLPKRKGTRPIMNLRRKMMTVRDGKTSLGTSINAALSPVFSMLNYEKMNRKDRLGAALFSVGDMHGRVRCYKQMLAFKEHSKVYLVKTDVQSCFDNIPQRRLIELIRAIVSEDQYSISRHAEIKAADSRWSGAFAKPYRKFIALACPKNQEAVPGLFQSDSGRRQGGVVMVDTGKQQVYETSRLFKLLEEHVGANIVKIGTKYHRQRKGIPQGSILSTLLCNFFYGRFETSKLAFLGEDSLLLRLVDDSLLITTNQSHARRFLQIMSDGSNEFGITTNLAKNLVNFEVTINGSKIPQLHNSKEFPYCGMLINTDSLEVSKDRRRDDSRLEHSLSVEINKSPGQTFQRRVLHSFKIQMHAMIIDTKMNSKGAVLTNLYQMHRETAMKLLSYLKALRGSHAPGQKLIIETCGNVLRLAINLTRGERSTKAIESYECAVSRRQHRWLMATAFEDVFVKKQARYPTVLTWLRTLEQESRRSFGLNGAEASKMVENGRKAFQGYQY